MTVARTWGPAVAVYAVILAVSAVPGESLRGTPGWTAVAGHALGYALLAAALHRATGGRGSALVVITLVLLLGLLNEVEQSWVSGRTPDVADVGVDLLGALGGVVASGLGRAPRGWR